MFKALCVILAAVAVLIGRAPSASGATASAWGETDHSAARLISGVDGVGDEDVVRVGLQMTLRPGWKTYWRSPGDAGFPPQIDWSGSENITSATIRWPAPERFSAAGFETIGYTKEVVLPIDIAVTSPGQPLRLQAGVDYLVCDDICIPYSADLDLTIPSGPATPNGLAHLIDQYANSVPGDGARHGLALSSLSVDHGAPAETLLLLATAAWPFENPDVYVEGPPSFIFDPPTVSLQPSGTEARISIPVIRIDNEAAALAGLPLTITLVDGDRSAEREMIVTTNEMEANTAPTAGTLEESGSLADLLPILAIAVLGGLILNLMPCVLPVLSIKVLSIMGHGGAAPRAVRLSFLASAAGIIVSFLALAATLAALKAAGAGVGWGIQFQQPWFLTAMVILLVLFAANLWGLFEFQLPQAVAAADARAAQANGLWAPFLTGAFATLLATPCSAPFVGTAVGFALSRSTAEIMAVFFALGLGLALPYLAIAAAPAMATRLPRPGPWMATLKRFLALALFATAIWLLTVLAVQLGIPATLSLVGIAAATLLWLAVCSRRPAWTGWRWPLVGLGVIAAFALPVITPVADTNDTALETGYAAENAIWTSFDPERIDDLVADGHVVYVNVTADWCITCKVNEQAVLDRDEILSRLASPEIIAMRGDWTVQDERISQYLSKFGRYGIPFDAVYGPGMPNGEALSELLTVATVNAALDRAANSAP